MVERSLPTPEIHGSNPSIGKVLPTNFKLNRKDENKEKEAKNVPLKNLFHANLSQFRSRHYN